MDVGVREKAFQAVGWQVEFGEFSQDFKVLIPEGGGIGVEVGDEGEAGGVGVEDMHPRHEFKTPDRPALAPLPARFTADIRAGNKIVVTDVVGVRKLAIWLEKDMIDWAKPVEFVVSGAPNVPKKGKMEPDLKLMFEELYRTGDKKMLFFGKVEIKTQG